MGFMEAPGGALVHYVDLDLHGEALHAQVNDPVVLIHGLGCNWRHWSRQIGWIAHSRRTIAPDVRSGARKTRWAHPGWTTADMASDIHALVTGLGLHRPAIAGISMGGTIAPAVRARPPRCPQPARPGRLLRQDPGRVHQRRDEQPAFINTHSLRQIAEQRMAAAFTTSADPATKAWVIDVIAGGDLDGYRNQARATLAFDVRRRLAKITAPATIIHGELDTTVPAAFATATADAIPGATLHIIDGQGHFPILEAPERFNPLLAGALGIPNDLVPAR